MTTAAILTGARSRRAVVQFGRASGRDFLRLLGLPEPHPPSEATPSRVLRALDPAAPEALVRGWVATRLGPRRFGQIALDGEALRGTRGGGLPAAHLLAAYACEAGAAAAQPRVDPKTNEHKAAPELLGVPPLEGKGVTAGAMVTHRDSRAGVRARGGQYVLPVKDNQPDLGRDVRAPFGDPPAGLSPPAEGVARRDVRFGRVAR